ncbi:endonuclease/exonuclease/phosphatase family protein [Hyphomonas pacifica]|uniref:endonuclease/exonuclease/phosphatase family protein n=1 Tax=Hyphomonas pacifica TaxID=1280941 RepID=UPI000DC030AA|nr:endonuclease/exonuclease/phosphatase family protein [Hyphomonas pacifica]RAN32034.1 hypothetical protein HY11_05530 [Hyphomonas pacifica]
MFALLEILFLIIGSFGLFAAISPKLRTEAWWLRIWTYARLQFCILLAVSALLYIAFFPVGSLLSIIILSLHGIAFIMYAADIWPYLPGRPKEVPRAPRDATGAKLSILLINVLQENQDHAAVLDRIDEAGADIVFLSETSEAWREALSDIEADYPYTYLLPLEEHNGLLFYSRLPIQNVQERYLCQDHIPSLTIDVDLQGEEIRLYCIHPRPPRPRDKPEHLDDELMIVADELREQDRPAMVIGDFNEVGWSWMVREFKRHAQLCDPKRGRGLYNSYSAQNPLLAWPLDHAFVTNDFYLTGMRRLPACGSDHYPILYGFQRRKA